MLTDTRRMTRSNYEVRVKGQTISESFKRRLESAQPFALTFHGFHNNYTQLVLIGRLIRNPKKPTSREAIFCSRGAVTS